MSFHWRNYSQAQWMRLGGKFSEQRVRGSPSTHSRLMAQILAPIAIATACLLTPTERAPFSCVNDVNSSEDSRMKLCIASTALMIAPQAVGQALDLARTTDTVKLTQQVPASNQLTIEACLWLPNGATTLGALSHVVWREQRNSAEDKAMSVCSAGVIFAGVGSIPVIVWEGVVPTEQWVHVVCQASQGVGKIWIDGTLVAEAGTPNQNLIWASDQSDNCIGFGLHNGSQPVPGAVCRLDWLRVSTCARYFTAKFQPPRECDLGEPDGCTALLFTFDEPMGATVLQNTGFATGSAQVGAAWISGATTPSLGGEVQSCCPADVDLSRAVDGVDLAIVLQNWGVPSTQYVRADIDGDGFVSGADLSLLLSDWGACP